MGHLAPPERDGQFLSNIDKVPWEEEEVEEIAGNKDKHREVGVCSFVLLRDRECNTEFGYAIAWLADSSTVTRRLDQ
jgi:hypothetical protein